MRVSSYRRYESASGSLKIINAVYCLPTYLFNISLLLIVKFKVHPTVDHMVTLKDGPCKKAATDDHTNFFWTHSESFKKVDDKSLMIMLLGVIIYSEVCQC